MKAQTTTAQRKPALKHQRLKIALIPVLILVLAYVLFAPADGPLADNVPIDNVLSRSPAAGTASASQPATGAAAQANRSAKAQAWPEASLQFLGTSNPFESLNSQPVETVDQRFVTTNAAASIKDVDHMANVASELERLPVNFVFRSSKQNVIMLGDEVLEKGAHLSPAVQLHDIGDNTLLLKLHP